jgi:hypothetical protein
VPTGTTPEPMVFTWLVVLSPGSWLWTLGAFNSVRLPLQGLASLDTEAQCKGKEREGKGGC